MSTMIHVPRGLTGLAPVSLDLEVIIAAEGRIRDVAHVTPLKAPELLATFNLAFLECSRFIALLEGEHVLARRRADRVRSSVILDKVPQVLAQRGLSTSKNPMGSEDLRKAVLDGDDEYSEAIGRVDEIGRYLELLKGKQKGVEMAYTSVKKLLGEQAFNFGHRGMTAGNEGNATAGQTIPGIGKGRYG